MWMATPNGTNSGKWRSATIPVIACSGGGRRKSALHLLHRGIQRSDELTHRRRGFIAHVRDAEGGVFDLSVAAVNEKALVLYQLLKFRDVHGASAGFRAVVDARESDGLEAG